MNLKKTIYNLISNPLVQIVILLLIILTILGMIRITEPDFKLGASIGGNIGSIKAGASIEGFNSSL